MLIQYSPKVLTGSCRHSWRRFGQRGVRLVGLRSPSTASGTGLGVEAPQQAPLMHPPGGFETDVGLLGRVPREMVAVGTDRGLQPLDVALLGFSLGVSAQQVALSSAVYTLGQPTSDAPGTPLWSRRDNVLGATGSAGSLGRHLAPRGSSSSLRGAYIQTIQPLDLGQGVVTVALRLNCHTSLSR